MANEIDLTKCQDCGTNPAIYGDGLTWSRCSACELKRTQEGGSVPQEQAPVAAAEGIEHKIVDGLVSIIMPVHIKYNYLLHYTGNAIGSIREHTPADAFELVVVDNGSPVKVPSPQSYYAHRVISNEGNFGVTKAWNQGIRMSIGEYIVLINNDVQVFEGWLEDLKRAIDEEGYHVAMAHPMYSLSEPFARAFESKRLRAKNTGKYSDFKDFSCVMFKRSLLDEIGLFDEDFFNYCSDSDFFKRVEAVGAKWTCVESVATSHISDATGSALLETPEILARDKGILKHKWKSIKPASTGKEKKLVRIADDGDPLYLLETNVLHHIADPETLTALGFDFGQEEVISDRNSTVYKIGEKITMQNYEKYA